MSTCSVPGCTGTAVIKGECRACYMYRRRNGVSREAQLVKRAIADFERAQFRRIVRQIVAASETISPGR